LDVQRIFNVVDKRVTMPIKKRLKMSIPHLVPEWCLGEKCSMCKKPASHKVYQDSDEAVTKHEFDGKTVEVPHHPLTAYVCCRCFRKIMGPIVWCGK
jgi:hypothetical protein